MGWSLLAAVVLGAPPALAAQTGEAVEATAEVRPAPEPERESVSEEGKGQGDLLRKENVRLFGRVYARVAADGRRKYARDFDIASARIGAKASFDNIEAEVMADLASSDMLKDAYLRLADDGKRLRLYGGRFKAPFLARELESSWDLPLLERGLVADYLTETNQLGGRRFGVMGEARLKKLKDVRFAAGIFEGARDELGQRASEDVAARASVQPLEMLTVGASTYLSEAFGGTRLWAGAADATLELGRVRVSGELSAGRVGLGTFRAQTALATYRLALGPADWSLEPLAGLERLQIDAAPGLLEGHALLGGVNLHYTDRFKAQLQAERALRPGDERPGVELSLQLATRF